MFSAPSSDIPQNQFPLIMFLTLPKDICLLVFLSLFVKDYLVINLYVSEILILQLPMFTGFEFVKRGVFNILM